MPSFAKTLATGIAVGLSMMAGGNAMADTYASNFSAAGTGGDIGAPGYYYFDPHQATQTFSGTGLTSVSELELTLNYGSNGNYATQPLGFTFYLDGVQIGTDTYTPGDNSIHSLDFLFPALTDMSGEWTLLMDVSTPVCSGCGAVQFSTNNPLTLTGSAVPEPATLSLLGLSLAFLGLRRRPARS